MPALPRRFDSKELTAALEVALAEARAKYTRKMARRLMKCYRRGVLTGGAGGQLGAGALYVVHYLLESTLAWRKMTTMHAWKPDDVIKHHLTVGLVLLPACLLCAAFMGGLKCHGVACNPAQVHAEVHAANRAPVW